MKTFYTTILCCLLWLIATVMQAQTSYSSVTGTGTFDWNSPASWVGGVVPPTNLAAGSTIYVRCNEVQINANITYPNRLSIVVTNSAVLDVRGSNILSLSNNSSEVVVLTSGQVKGQNNNSVIKIGTSPTQSSYSPNGANGTINGPTRMTNIGQALPVTLVYFSAIIEGNRVSLVWATTEELNVKQFVVERSPTLSEFTSVGTVAAAGTTQTRQNYGLIDNAPLTGTSYYRLRQDDLDGSVNYSKTVAVNVTESAPGLLVLGNPVRLGVIRLSVQNLDGASYKLATLSGQNVDLQASAQGNGEVALTPIRTLPTGTYLLSAQLGAVRLVRKLVVE